jgi:MFS family permease
MSALSRRLRHTFRALGHRDFRTFFFGQWVSVTGTWMQTTALAWLVYRLTHSPLTLGALAAARFGPSLVAAPLAGVVADRFPRRTLVLVTQSLSLAQATTLSALTLTGTVRVWHLLVLAFLGGAVDTLDMPARQTLQVDLVGIEDLQSAVSLNSSAFNAGRMVGPAIAGVLVAAYGEAVCFAFNAASYVAVLIALLTIRPVPAVPASHASWREELVEGWRYAWRTPRVRLILFAVAITSGFGLSYTALMPVFAGDVLHAGPRGFGVLLAAGGCGAIVGALLAGSRRSSAGAGVLVALGQGALGLGLVALGTIRNFAVAVATMVVIGISVALQLSTSNGFLQTTSPPQLRGRAVALYLWLFAGLAPIGALLAGAVAERAGAPATVAGVGAVCVVSAVVVAREVGARWRGSQQVDVGRGEGFGDEG